MSLTKMIRKKKNKITSETEESLIVNKGKLDYLNVYEITEDELDRMGRGGSDSIFLNFAIFSFSIAISFLITLLTTSINSDRTFSIFLILTILGFLSGGLLLILWWKNRLSVNELTGRIKDRMKKRI